jgi:hypothetical protein
LVEGSQQVALARYVLKNFIKIEDTIMKSCFTSNLDGTALRDSLLPLVEYWQFESKLETFGLTDIGNDAIYQMGNATGFCSPGNVTFYQQNMQTNIPLSLAMLMRTLTDGIYVGLGIKIPIDKLEKKSSLEIAIDSWWVVYVYYWSSFCLLLGCSTIFLFLIRRHKADIFDFVSVIARLLAIIIGACMIAVIADDQALWTFISSPGVLPTCLALLFLVQFFDRISAMFANWRIKKSGEQYAFEDRDGSHDGKHGEVHVHDPQQEPLVPDHRKSAAWSLSSDREPLTEDTAYHHHPPEAYHMEPLTSPVAVGHAPAGYAPVHHGHGQV